MHPHSSTAEPNQTAAPDIESTTVGDPPSSPVAVPTASDGSPDLKMAHPDGHAQVLRARQGWLTRRLVAIFGPRPVAHQSCDATKVNLTDMPTAGGSGSHTSVSIHNTSTTLTNVPSATATVIGASTLTRRQSTIDRGASLISTTARRPSILSQQSRVLQDGRPPSPSASVGSGRYSDAKSDMTRSSGSPSLTGSQISSLIAGQSLDWFYTVGRSADIGRSFSSSAAPDAESTRQDTSTHVFRPHLPPPAIVVDTCAFVARFGTSSVYTEPSDDEFLSRYSPHVNTWSSMYDPVDGSRLDPARDPVSFTVAKFGQHRKTVTWAAMEALRYWLLAHHVPVVPLSAFQTGYRTLLGAEPGKVAQTLVEYLKMAISEEGDWGTFKHIVRHARKEAGRHEGLVEWMAKDWGSALAQAEDRGEWKSQSELAKWMDGTMMPVMVVLLTSRAPLE